MSQDRDMTLIKYPPQRGGSNQKIGIIRDGRAGLAVHTLRLGVGVVVRDGRPSCSPI
jgi:hypothetical protein